MELIVVMIIWVAFLAWIGLWTMRGIFGDDLPTTCTHNCDEGRRCTCGGNNGQ